MARDYKYKAEQRSTWLSSDWGCAYAMKVFDITLEELEAKVGRYVRGKRKGQLRGLMTWMKTTKGGWVKTGRYDQEAMQGCGFVAGPNITYGHSVTDFNHNVLLGVDDQMPGALTDDLARRYFSIKNKGVNDVSS